MENLILSFNVVIPLFINIMLGYFIKRIKLIDERTLKVMNNVTFKTFLPLLLFYNVYKTDLNGAINAKLMIFAPAAIFTACILATIVIIGSMNTSFTYALENKHTGESSYAKIGKQKEELNVINTGTTTMRLNRCV